MTELIGRPMQIDDQEDLIELFETVFGHTVTPLMWAWKYMPPWASKPYCWVGVCNDKVIGYFGAVPARGYLGDHEIPFFHFADFMVHPDYRRKFDYFSLGLDRVLEELGGDHPEYLIYGFSDHRAFLGFRRSGLGDLVEKAVNYYVRPVKTRTKELQVTDLDWQDDVLDEFWKKHRSSVGIGLVRDKQYLTWRYGYHPVFRYKPFALQRDGDTVGWFVIGNDGAGKNGRPKEIPVVDMLLAPELVRPGLQALSDHLDHDLMTWLPSRLVPDWEDQKATGTHVYHFKKDSIVETDQMRNELYYTMGDADWW